MFSSNQKFEISGDYSQLKLALDFALKFEDSNLSHMCYQITKDGKYCIGWAPEGRPEHGWKNYDFDFDTEIVSKIIKQTLDKFEAEKSGYEWADGSTDKGFIMRAIPDYFSDDWEGIKHPFYGIIYFEPYTNFYAK